MKVLEYESARIHDDICGDCEYCIDYCPLGAIHDPEKPLVYGTECTPDSCGEDCREICPVNAIYWE